MLIYIVNLNPQAPSVLSLSEFAYMSSVSKHGIDLNLLTPSVQPSVAPVILRSRFPETWISTSIDSKSVYCPVCPALCQRPLINIIEKFVRSILQQH
uniref:Glycosyltransferase family 4 protein n=1 Tax=Heterorhabditis bacteriophora TaxID=37862 RepID=A0A1I7WRW7_HETBA